MVSSKKIILIFGFILVVNQGNLVIGERQPSPIHFNLADSGISETIKEGKFSSWYKFLSMPHTKIFLD